MNDYSERCTSSAKRGCCAVRSTQCGSLSMLLSLLAGRVGYRNLNRQTEGQSVGRPGLLLNGRRLRESGEDLFSTNGLPKG